jgi:SAM-dependent methyltransferase
MGQIRRRVRGGVLGAARRLPPPRDEAAVSVLRSVNSLVRGRVPEAAVPIRPGPEQASLQDLLDSAFASGDQARIGKAVKQLHALQIHAERLASPLSSEKGRLAETKGVKSIQYMIDLLPHIQQVIGQHPLHTTFEILDVGPGSGHGTALLAQLYRRSPLGYTARVSALDINDLYARYIATIAPHVRFIRSDIFDHDKTYDIVVSSHVIEHVPDPVGFCHRLQQMARLAVFVSAPYNEPAEGITKGHINIIDEATVAQLGADEVTIMKSVSWGPFKDPPYDSVIARLRGLADR